MPTYTFEHKKTKELYTDLMSISEMEEFINNKKNKDWVLIPAAPAIGDSVRLGITKPPADFMKNIVGRIKNSVPGAKNVERRFQIPKEI